MTDIHQCPRCELRFANRPELVDHLVVDHDVTAETLERFRYPKSPAVTEQRSAGRRCLVVADQTIGGPEVIVALRSCIDRGVTQFLVLVPATAVGDQWDERMTGTRDAAVTLAEARLRSLVDALATEDCDVQGHVGPADPELAVTALLHDEPVDEILVATLPNGMSPWLAMDLSSRLRRRCGLPVTTVEARSTAWPGRSTGSLWPHHRRRPLSGLEREDKTMDGQVGDRIVVRGRRVGEPNAVGSIIEVLSGNRFRVRWADGRESTAVPGADATIERNAQPEGPRDLALTVDLRIHEDADRCRADAVMHTASGVLRGSGEARRHPEDPAVPLIGEELAVARALGDLASTLERAASQCIASHDRPTKHLVG